MQEKEIKTRVSIWGVLLSPVWLFLKLVIFIGNILGGLASSVLQWIAGIAFVLDIIVWITLGFGMFMLVMIPIILCYAFPYIWGIAFGVLDTMCDGIAYLWHIPVKADKYNNIQNNNNTNNCIPNNVSNNTNNTNTKQENILPNNMGSKIAPPQPSDKSDDDWEPEGYAEFVAETKAMNAKSDKIQD